MRTPSAPWARHYLAHDVGFEIERSEGWRARDVEPTGGSSPRRREVDRIEVHWPSGNVSLRHDVATNQCIEIDEGDPACPHIEGGECPIVSVDVEPFDSRNIVDLSRSSDIKVVILGSPQVDGANIDPEALLFGRGRTRPSSKWPSLYKDFTGDRIVDVLSFYHIHQADILPGDVEVCVPGQLYDRTPFSG